MRKWRSDEWATVAWLLVYAALFVGVVLYALLTHDHLCLGGDC